MTRDRIVGLWALCALVGGFARGLAAAPVEQYAEEVAKTPGLVAWWRFEGDLKDTKGVADGTAGGGAGKAVFADGPGGGKALALADNRFVTTGANPKLDLPQATVELWLRPDFQPGARYNPCIIAMRAPGDHKQTRFSFHVWHDYSSLAMWNGRSVVQFAPALGPLEKGKWYCLVFTCTAGELRAYVDGVPCVPAQSTETFTFANNGLPLLIGSSTPKGQEQLDCLVDEVAVYSRPLTGEEIARHADAMGWKARREAVAARLATLQAQREQRRQKRLAELSDEKVLFARGQSKAHAGEQLSAISLPVGGIGSGLIQMDGKARMAVWQIFGNYPYVTVPDSFFAVRVQAGKGKPVLRALQTEAIGPWAAMKELTFRGEYPFGWYTFQDPAVPAKISMEVFSPLIPLETKDSSIPCAVFNLTAENTGKEDASVSFLGVQKNVVGYTGRAALTLPVCKELGRNVNRVVAEDGAVLLHMSSEKKGTPGSGDMVLMALTGDASASASSESLAKLASDLSDDGALTGPASAGPSEDGRTLDGAVAAPLVLKPGQKKTVTFVLAWYFPNTRHGGGAWGGSGCMYQNWWPDALGVARYLKTDLPKLTEQTHLYHDTFYASNLPWWLLDRVGSQVAVLRSQTCFWTKDGYFGGWEGCCPGNGCCQGNCSHVWHYAQAHARLFPQIARLMREQELRYEEPSGSVPHRQPRSHTATDGQCGTVLGAYREHLMSPDGKWLQANWPKVRKAMDFIITTWDPDEDGVMAGWQWNTLDCAIDGSSSWLGSLYLAALAAGEKMALLQGQADLAARYRKIRLSGMAKQNETLFDGEYYFQLPGQKRIRDYLTGCHIDQVLGQWWAHQLDLGWVYPAPRVRTAMGSLVKYNFRTDFHGVPQLPRKFVDDDDSGMQMIKWPKGGRPPAGNCMLYGDEVMTGFEYAAAATMVQAGLLKDGLMITRAIYDRYDGRLRKGLTGSATASWGHSGNPFGDDECGKFYARAMSVWSILLACQGFIYDGPAGVIGFAPVWQPDDHRSMFNAAEGWGLFSQRRDRTTQTARIDLRFGKLALKTIILELPENAKASKVQVKVGDQDIAAKPAASGQRIQLQLAKPVTLQAGEALEATISY